MPNVRKTISADAVPAACCRCFQALGEECRSGLRSRPQRVAAVARETEGGGRATLGPTALLQASLQEVLAQAPGCFGSDWIVGLALIEEWLRKGVLRTRIDEHFCTHSRRIRGS